MIKATNWYVLCVQPKWKKRVMESLSRKEVTYYYPDLFSKADFKRRREDIYSFFGSMVFINTTKENLKSLERISGVNSLLFWLNEPAIIRNEEIEAIKNFMQASNNISLERVDITPGVKYLVTTDTSTSNENIETTYKPEDKLTLTTLGLSFIAYQDSLVYKSVA